MPGESHGERSLRDSGPCYTVRHDWSNLSCVHELGVLNTEISFATNYLCDLSCCIHLKQRSSLEIQSKRGWILILFTHTDTARFVKWQNLIMQGRLPRWCSGKESACQYRRRKGCEFDPRVGKIPWRRAWPPTPVFLPGESHGQRSLVGYSPWAAKSWVRLNTQTQTATQGLAVNLWWKALPLGKPRREYWFHKALAVWPRAKRLLLSVFTFHNSIMTLK